jgi:hypothetical protein
MPNYTVQYAFTNDDADVKNKKFGYAKTQVNTDLPVETEEQRIEIARYLGTKGGFTSVGIMDIKPSDRFTEDDETVYEGEIVI